MLTSSWAPVVTKFSEWDSYLLEIIRIGLRSQNRREEIITIHDNQVLVDHALEVEVDDLEMVKVVQETIEDVLETNVTIVIESEITI